MEFFDADVVFFMICDLSMDYLILIIIDYILNKNWSEHAAVAQLVKNLKYRQ